MFTAVFSFCHMSFQVQITLLWDSMDITDLKKKKEERSSPKGGNHWPNVDSRARHCRGQSDNTSLYFLGFPEPWSVVSSPFCSDRPSWTPPSPGFHLPRLLGASIVPEGQAHSSDGQPQTRVCERLKARGSCSPEQAE